MHALDDTIAAIASPPGGAARGIVRLSGPGLRTCLEGCFRPDPYISLPSLARPTAAPGLCWLAGVAAPLPGELYLWPGRRSYTGQPVAEIHTLGSPPLLEALLRTVCAARQGGRAGRIHPAGLPGRTNRPHAGRGRAGRDRRHRPTETARRLDPACRRAGPAAPSAPRPAAGPVGPARGRAGFRRGRPAAGRPRRVDRAA